VTRSISTSHLSGQYILSVNKKHFHWVSRHSLRILEISSRIWTLTISFPRKLMSKF